MASIKRYAWDNLQFRKWWEKYGYLNKNIDPYTLRSYSRKRLFYVDDWGRDKSIPTKELLRRASFSSIKTAKKIKYLVDSVPGIEDFINPKLNPMVNIKKIALYSKKQIYFINSLGEKDSVIPKTFYNRARNGFQLNLPSNWRNHSTGNKNNRDKKLMASEVDGFLEWFDIFKEYNHVDPYSLSKSDDTYLSYKGYSGVIRRVKTKNLCRTDIKKRIYSFKERLAINDPMFVEFMKAEKELNKEINLDLLLNDDRTSQIYYHKADGQIGGIIVESLFYDKHHNYGFHYPRNHVSVVPQKQIKKNPQKKAEQPVRKYKKMQCNEGHPFFNTSKETFEKYNGDLSKICPYCTGRRVLPEESAAAQDDDIELFWGNNNVSPDKVSPNKSKAYNYVCPYCGYAFSKAIKNMVRKYPKCPRCKDLGLLDNKTVDLPEKIVVVFRERKAK